MTHEIFFPNLHRDPPPLSNEIQKVTLLEDGGWKAVIECPKTDQDEFDNDYQMLSLGAGINERRRQQMLRRMGI
ncbi:MAG TPA: hypothetical protein VMR19_00050 [Candidatus Saccharimonadales bacterium]|jgi:hypothetical protein|nr:hypothetical protein [Candidatus Saccharimonadales bacterium]